MKRLAGLRKQMKWWEKRWEKIAPKAVEPGVALGQAQPGQGQGFGTIGAMQPGQASARGSLQTGLQHGQLGGRGSLHAGQQALEVSPSLGRRSLEAQNATGKRPTVHEQIADHAAHMAKFMRRRSSIIRTGETNTTDLNHVEMIRKAVSVALAGGKMRSSLDTAETKTTGSPAGLKRKRNVSLLKQGVGGESPIVRARSSVAMDACSHTFRARGGAQRCFCLPFFFLSLPMLPTLTLNSATYFRRSRPRGSHHAGNRKLVAEKPKMGDVQMAVQDEKRKHRWPRSGRGRDENEPWWHFVVAVSLKPSERSPSRETRQAKLTERFTRSFPTDHCIHPCWSDCEGAACCARQSGEGQWPRQIRMTSSRRPDASHKREPRT